MTFRVISIKVALVAMIALGVHTVAMAQKEHRFTGRTMGTTYHVKIVAPQIESTVQVQSRIDQRLAQINQSMSTYRPQSEISRFNALQQTHQHFAISEDFYKVMRVGQYIFSLTQGAWDPTVAPLVLLWGFGTADPLQKLPNASDIVLARKQVGFDAIDVSPQGYLQKRRSNVTLDLASIAKGYGVDQVALLLKKMGFDHYLVEIGGEVYAAGQRLDGRSWRVGINQPRKGGDINAVYKVVPLVDLAMATSGDYRNYVRIDGRVYSHIIDPRTGYPVCNGVVSASVIADNCTLADGLATALMVMGAPKGIQLLNALEGVEGLIVVRRSDGSLEDHWSAGLVDAN